MKKLLTLLILCSLAFGAVAKPMFADRYKEMFKVPEDEGFLFKKFSRKDIRKLDDGDPDVKNMVKKASRMVMIVDTSDKSEEWPPIIVELLGYYEELISLTDEEMGIEIRGLMKGDKVDEVVVALYDDENFMAINMKFKSPIRFEDYMGNTGGNLSQAITINNDVEPGTASFKISPAGIKISHKSADTFTRPTTDDGFTLEIFGQDGKYGVKRAGTDLIVFDAQYNRVSLLGPNPGNTYILLQREDNPHLYLYDKFGHSMIWGLDFNFINIPGSEELGAVIVKRSYLYSLYECPEKYDLKPEGEFLNNEYLKPDSAFRIVDCKSIEQTSPGVFTCEMFDGTIEIVTIDRLKNGNEEKIAIPAQDDKITRNKNLSLTLGDISIGHNRKETISLPGYTDDGFTLEVFEENGKYGVKRVGNADHLLKPTYDHIKLLGTNPGNTYIFLKSDNNPYYYMYDKFGLGLWSGIEITPFFVPGSEELGCFISKYSENDYALYECPEKYELIMEGDFFNGGRLRPPYDYRIWDCRSIEQTSPGVFECVKKDGTKETVTIDRLKK